MDCSVVPPQPTDRVLLESPAPTQTHPKQKNDARVGLEDTRKTSTFSLPIEEKLHLVKLARQFETQFSSEKKVFFFFITTLGVKKFDTHPPYIQNLRIWRERSWGYGNSQSTSITNEERISSHPARTGKLRRQVRIHAWVPALLPTRNNPWITRVGGRKKFSTSLLLVEQEFTHYSESQSDSS